MMDFNGVCAALNALSTRGMDFGLERTRKLLNGLGSPDKKLKIIHIAGSNGKGSTAEFMTEILLAAGKTVGTFTSPAVFGYLCEFRINGAEIDKSLFVKAFEKALKLGSDATRFEVETAGALYAFWLAGCEYAVLECGLGGKYDATNAVAGKEIALITSVSLEHTSVLGNTVRDICAHKAGIIKDCPVVVCAYQNAEARAYFERLGAVFAEKYVGDITAAGCLQPYNAGLAAAAARILKIDENAIYSGVKRANPVGRVQIFSRLGVTYILDGAHNPAAFTPLCGELEKYKKSDVTVIYGCLGDKDINGNLAALATVAGQVTAVECDSPRALPLDETVRACKQYFCKVTTAAGVAQALESAKTATVAVCGSFTLLKEAKEWIEKGL